MAQSPGCLCVPNKALLRKVKCLTPEQTRELEAGGRAKDSGVGTKGFRPNSRERDWVHRPQFPGSQNYTISARSSLEWEGEGRGREGTLRLMGTLNQTQAFLPPQAAP